VSSAEAHPATSVTASRVPQWREAALVVAAYASLTAALTAPLAFRLGRVAYRVGNGDGQFSIWNTAWVARALVLDPLHVFDANIFYPHKGALAYSEANLGSGALAVPMYWTTGNVYAAHGFVVLLSFLLSAVGTYYLVRYLTGDRLAAAVTGIAFGFCPHVFAHLLHIQLLWTAGLPWSLLAFHLLSDRPSAWRGVALGLAMAAQLYLCAYYAVFLVLLVGGFTVAIAAFRRWWTDVTYWRAVAIAAFVAMSTSLPLLVPYLEFQRSTGFVRPLSASDGFSADWRAYFASSAVAHAWLLPLLGRWNEVLFPGFVAGGFSFAGIALGWQARGRVRETTVLYLLVGMLALWASFGPTAGLYRLLYAGFPAFSLMRAPSRFGVVVLLATCVLAGIGIARLRRRWLATPVAAAILVAVTATEHVVPLEFQAVPPPAPVYVALATSSPGALIEMPVYSERAQFARAKYMLATTIHWMPLVNAYSDYIPADFEARMATLGGFPSVESLRLLQEDGVRYAIFHLDDYGEMRPDLERRLEAFSSSLVLRYGDETARLYEIADRAK
jgi:hypothetical protein